MREDFGARIERGEVLEATERGYRVRSFCRDGIVTPPLPANGDMELEAGAKVYFFMFDDGDGLILSKFDAEEVTELGS